MPYFDIGKSVPIIASWDVNKISPLLAPKALKKIKTKSAQKTQGIFSIGQT